MSIDNRTVLVVDNGLLLSEGVRQLLASDSHLTVISTIFENEETLIQTIAAHHPDVVILTADLTFTRWDKLHAFFDGCKELRVLVLDSADDCIDIYDRRQVTVKRANDLLAIVRETPSRYRN